MPLKLFPNGNPDILFSSSLSEAVEYEGRRLLEGNMSPRSSSLDCSLFILSFAWTFNGMFGNFLY